MKDLSSKNRKPRPLTKWSTFLLGVLPAAAGAGLLFLAWSLTVEDPRWLSLLFRLAASGIGVVLLLCGTVMLALEWGRFHLTDLLDADFPDAESPNPEGCPKCGTQEEDEGAVSPHGDIQCRSCKNWYNIYGAE